jgi:hypothetical protein
VSVRENLRWKIANQMNRLPGQCWIDLVMWAQHGREDGQPVLPTRPIGWACRSDMARNGGCFCGKIRTGEEA